MAAIILDGAMSAASLPDSLTALVTAHSAPLWHAAVDVQKQTGLAIAELLGMIVTTNEEEVVGIAKLGEVLAELLATVSPRDRGNLQTFLATPCPASHLRVVLWTAAGFACVRVDTNPMAKGGAS